MHYFVKIGWLLWDVINYMLIFLAIIGLLFGAGIVEHLKILL